MSTKLLDMESEMIRVQMESRSLQKQASEQRTANQYLEDENNLLKHRIEH